MRKRSTPTADQLATGAQMMIALTGIVSDDPVRGFVLKRGARLRADHWAVERWPRLFVPDGLDDAELNALRVKRFGDRVA
jgi:hypothetical protein